MPHVSSDVSHCATLRDIARANKVDMTNPLRCCHEGLVVPDLRDFVASEVFRLNDPLHHIPITFMNERFTRLFCRNDASFSGVSRESSCRSVVRCESTRRALTRAIVRGLMTESGVRTPREVAVPMGAVVSMMDACNRTDAFFPHAHEGRNHLFYVWSPESEQALEEIWLRLEDGGWRLAAYAAGPITDEEISARQHPHNIRQDLIGPNLQVFGPSWVP